MIKKTALALALVGVLTACSGNQPKPVTEKEASEIEKSSTDAATKPTGGGYGSQPAGAGPAQSASGGAPAAGGVDKPEELVKLEKAFEADSKNEDTKKKLVEATYEFGNKVMLDPALAPRVKYPTALKMYKRVLEIDPTHKKAADDKKTIEDIYASMGRPVPE